MRRLRDYLLRFLFVFFLVAPSGAWAQEEEERISLRVVKIFGFRVGNKLQGRIGLRVEGPEDLVRVEFLMDGEVINEDAEAPYRYEFSSGEFVAGEHAISAVGYTSDGRALSSEVGTYTILTSDQAVEGVQKYMVPFIIGAVIFLVIAGWISSAVTRRKGKFRIGEYGPAGGAVCKRCGMPFSRHVLSPNLVVGKLEKCPNCGAVSVVRRGTPDELRIAEERLLADLHQKRQVPVDDEEERLRRMIDDSRFEM